MVRIREQKTIRKLISSRNKYSLNSKYLSYLIFTLILIIHIIKKNKVIKNQI
jgi:hypothetical protein